MTSCIPGSSNWLIGENLQVMMSLFEEFLTYALGYTYTQNKEHRIMDASTQRVFLKEVYLKGNYFIHVQQQGHGSKLVVSRTGNKLGKV